MLWSFPVVIRKVFSKMLPKEKASLTIVKKECLGLIMQKRSISFILANLEMAKVSDLNDQNSFQSTVDAPPGVPGMSKNPDNKNEVHSCELEG